jgi:hypothetical protein
VTFRSLFVFSIALLAAGCSRAPKNNEAIRQAVMDHLTKNTGLDVNSMKIDVASVQYRGNEADAVVRFQPKNMPGGGMSITYTLESKGNKWSVKKKAGSGMGAHPGAEMPGAAGSEMPSGHPAPSGAQPSGALPPGHPPMASTPDTPAKK